MSTLGTILRTAQVLRKVTPIAVQAVYDIVTAISSLRREDQGKFASELAEEIRRRARRANEAIDYVFTGKRP